MFGRTRWPRVGKKKFKFVLKSLRPPPSLAAQNDGPTSRVQHRRQSHYNDTCATGRSRHERSLVSRPPPFRGPPVRSFRCSSAVSRKRCCGIIRCIIGILFSSCFFFLLLLIGNQRTRTHQQPQPVRPLYGLMLLTPNAYGLCLCRNNIIITSAVWFFFFNNSLL